MIYSILIIPLSSIQKGVIAFVILAYGSEELYNYTTFAMKEVHPGLWMESHIKAHKFFNDYAYDVTPMDYEQGEIVLNQLSIF